MFCLFSYWVLQNQDLHPLFQQVLRRLGQKKHYVVFENCSQGQHVYTWKSAVVFISEIDEILMNSHEILMNPVLNKN